MSKRQARERTSRAASSSGERGTLDVVALVGRLSKAAEERVLPSGSRLASFDVTVAREGARSQSVPVVWFDAPPSACSLDQGTEIVVTGRVRRRFFRTELAVQSRTEVAAHSVQPCKRTRKTRQMLARARWGIEEAMQEPGLQERD